MARGETRTPLATASQPKQASAIRASSRRLAKCRPIPLATLLTAYRSISPALRTSDAAPVSSTALAGYVGRLNGQVLDLIARRKLVVPSVGDVSRQRRKVCGVWGCGSRSEDPPTTPKIVGPTMINTRYPGINTLPALSSGNSFIRARDPRPPSRAHETISHDFGGKPATVSDGNWVYVYGRTD